MQLRHVVGILKQHVPESQNLCFSGWQGLFGKQQMYFLYEGRNVRYKETTYNAAYLLDSHIRAINGREY